MNLQPSEAEVGLDIRMPPNVHTEALERRLVEEWAPPSRNLTFEVLFCKHILINTSVSVCEV
jgi:aminoacylase